ncbi:methylenetetrahydrofolate dehydrogenase (NADP+) / methenyltetrahydrofolate cyclohydrolase [Abditibacterium utsteinense]|uniref:Bifunctional protein FolD n=1 Tax=Abditibacterium utsteinense TaxID=1960156 RepID=A0A2S8SRH6_9BACT|nr:tetrahydrofolate dehydrogenase/cyclohydrolase catalytic domain-containing protein [Abditibacterium utsteinense]PQV63385.1 methylenetetrahydrofolate dehydrogenase (NADP+) / methenyltetrahydrofolate cyclohydrolase [Abditibacterium utsteinense]
MILLDGKTTAQKIRDAVKIEAIELEKQGHKPGLGTILVGDDPASAVYIGAKIKACEEANINSIHAQLPANSTKNEVLQQIEAFNQNPAVSAYIVQLPLPKGLDEEAALLAIDPDKDADGLHPVNLGRLVMGARGALPCTPAGILELLREYQVPVEGKHVVIVGRGLTIGRPLSLLLALKRPGCNAAVTVVHTGVKNLRDYTLQADILIAAAGSPNLIKNDWVKPGAAVVGGGLTRGEGRKIVSDVDDSVSEVAGWMTPRVGGVGPMTVAMLLKNTVEAAKKQLS